MSDGWDEMCGRCLIFLCFGQQYFSVTIETGFHVADITTNTATALITLPIHAFICPSSINSSCSGIGPGHQASKKSICVDLGSSI